MKFSVGDILFVSNGFFYIIEAEAHREPQSLRCFPGQHIKINTIGGYVGEREILITRREIFSNLSLEEIKNRLHGNVF